MKSIILALIFILASYSSEAMSEKKLKKYFDINNDNRLSQYEWSLLRTHLLKKYPLITKRKQRAYDFNQSYMLEPFEYSMYLKDKKAGKLRKLPKEKRGKVAGIENGIRYIKKSRF